MTWLVWGDKIDGKEIGDWVDPAYKNYNSQSEEQKSAGKGAEKQYREGVKQLKDKLPFLK